MDGLLEGDLEENIDGKELEAGEGLFVGDDVGDVVGKLEGCVLIVGREDGFEDIVGLGVKVVGLDVVLGLEDDTIVGFKVGLIVGLFDGLNVGLSDGCLVGLGDCPCVGEDDSFCCLVGFGDGLSVASIFGDSVGDTVFEEVGLGVTAYIFS